MLYSSRSVTFFISTSKSSHVVGRVDSDMSLIKLVNSSDLGGTPSSRGRAAAVPRCVARARAVRDLESCLDPEPKVRNRPCNTERVAAKSDSDFFSASASDITLSASLLTLAAVKVTASISERVSLLAVVAVVVFRSRVVELPVLSVVVVLLVYSELLGPTASVAEEDLH